jgi:hypothetical protein
MTGTYVVTFIPFLVLSVLLTRVIFDLNLILPTVLIGFGF